LSTHSRTQKFKLFVAVEALESFFSRYGTLHFCVDPIHLFKRHFELLVSFLRLKRKNQ